MSYLKKGLGLFLASAMVAGSLAGCGSSAETTEAPAADSAAAEETVKEDTAAAPAEDAADSGEVPTFTVATVRWTDAWPIDFLEEGLFKELEEKHGINIEWQVYYAGDFAEQKSLLFASGDLPDAFFGSCQITDSDLAQNKASFVELTDLIAENMPNLTAIFEKEPSLLAAAKDRNGEIYSLVKKLPLRPTVCGDVMFINKEWLDNLGMEVPTTLDELTTVLKAFVTEDADGDGDPNNEIAISGSKSDSYASGALRTILAPFGTMVSRTGNYMMLDAEGNPTFAPITENYVEAVKWYSDLYQFGAIDPEAFTQDDSMRKAKLQAEGGSQVGIVTGWTADAQVGINVDQFVTLEAVEGWDGQHYAEAATDYLDISDRELIITNKCEDPAKLLQWADDFYTDLASVQTFYGPIGDQIKDNGDGTYEVLVPADGTSLDTSAWSYSTRDFGPKYMNPDFYDNVILPSDQGDGVKLADDELNAKYITDDKNRPFPVVKYTEEELQRLTTLGTDIYKYVEAQFAHWVVDGGIEEEWDAYIEQLNAMGLQELLEIQNTAYQAYLESMK